ncbi:unnamed protein product [Clonostachys rhizophaga]|uniref:Uncharacterized protein n=1 Tax=Clonostachys rhizophaga TaxID=160324 RepID=A0A9N9YW78_9HYPO|nr:unnamed protein product [Clonostachys rhizophaga]
MVCLKQLSLTAVVALSLSETGLAAPVYVPINERALEDRAIKNFISGIRKHGGSAWDSGVAAVGAAADFKSAFFPQPQQPQQRSLEHLEDRGIKTQRLKKGISGIRKHGGSVWDSGVAAVGAAADFKNAFFPQPKQPQRRNLEHLEGRGVKTQRFKKAASSFGRNTPQAIERVATAVSTVADFKNAFFPHPQQPQRRSLEELQQRAFEDYIRELYF